MHYFEHRDGIQYPDINKILCNEYNPKENVIDEMLENIFIAANLDIEHYGTDEWNPLRTVISPGQCVLLKPNLVMDYNPAEQDYQRGLESLITHPSIVHTLFYFVKKALDGKGTIIVADAPIQRCNFDKLLVGSKYYDLFEFFKTFETENLRIRCCDLRETQFIRSEKGNIQVDVKPAYAGKVIDLGNDSYFRNVKKKNRTRVTSYVGKDTTSHHTNRVNEYCISQAILDADVIISIPKPKTHRIAGYTAALKNMIGVNARKEYLPHHRRGIKDKHGYGDEHDIHHRLVKYINSSSNDVRNWATKNGFMRVQKIANQFGRFSGKFLDKVEPNRPKFGMWYGNDTIWRTILDLNHIVYYVDKNGVMQENIQRKILYLGDMIVSGEGEGPLNPSYKYVGGLLFSDNPVEFDEFVVKVMGFDKKKIPTIDHATTDTKINNIHILNTEVDSYSNEKRFDKEISQLDVSFDYIPTKGWIGHIEH